MAKFYYPGLLSLILFICLPVTVMATIAIQEVIPTTAPGECKGKVVLIVTGSAGPFQVEVVETGQILNNTSGELLIDELCEGIVTLRVNPESFPHCITELSANVTVNPALLTEPDEPSFADHEQNSDFKLDHSSSAAEQVRIMPNPSDGRIHVEFGLDGIPAMSKIEILDANGRVLRIETIKAELTEKRFDLTQYPGGVYYLKVSEPLVPPYFLPFILR